MIVCERCGSWYDWRKSSSGSLKMTFCSILCELAENGITIEQLINAKRKPGPEDDHLALVRRMREDYERKHGPSPSPIAWLRGQKEPADADE